MEVKKMTLSEKITLACDADQSYTDEGKAARDSITLAEAQNALETL